MERILIIEDDGNILTGLRDSLEMEGYEVITAGDGERGLTLAREKRPDLIILDIMLPRRSGYDVCRELQAGEAKIPTIILSAKDKEVDKILGLELGADDYVTKPFSVRELQARVKALLRRCRGEEKEELEIYKFGPFKFDFKRYEALKNDRPLDLTVREFQVMKYLIQRRGEAISRDDLLDKVWGYDVYPSTRTVDNHIAHLRKQIEEDSRNPKYILGVRGIGYKFIG